MSLFSKIGKFVGRLAKNPALQIGASFVPGGGIAAKVIGGITTASQISQVLSTPSPTADARARAFISGSLPQLNQMSLPALPGIGGGFTTGGVMTSSNLPAVVDKSGQLCAPSGYHFARDGSGRIVKNRHMNPLNPRAARRAIRRIKGAMTMLKSIERQLPKRTVRARAPAKR